MKKLDLTNYKPFKGPFSIIQLMTIFAVIGVAASWAYFYFF